MKIRYLLNGELKELGEIENITTSTSTTGELIQIEFVTKDGNYGLLYIHKEK